MRILLDTNILTRLAQPDHAMYAVASSAVHRLRQRKYQICLVPQVIYEYWAVCTRPADQNGLGLSMAETIGELGRVKRLFVLLRTETGLYFRWEKLVIDTESKGKTSHDARLVAAMERNAITELLTFNAAHFARFQGITVRQPESILESPTPK
jgi:predicted nucleic acid-binding protein